MRPFRRRATGIATVYGNREATVCAALEICICPLPWLLKLSKQTLKAQHEAFSIHISPCVVGRVIGREAEHVFLHQCRPHFLPSSSSQASLQASSPNPWVGDACFSLRNTNYYAFNSVFFCVVLDTMSGYTDAVAVKYERCRGIYSLMSHPGGCSSRACYHCLMLRNGKSIN
jgi:hypothetical protein